jgi:transcriptional regulator with XRE-family HTH domain
MKNEPSAMADPWEQRLGEEVRRLRHGRQLTQLELAQRAAVSTSALKYLESGKGSSLATFTRVAVALGREEWLASFPPPAPTISPMALLRASQLDAVREPRRVRHRSSTTDAV